MICAILYYIKVRLKIDNIIYQVEFEHKIKLKMLNLKKK